MAASNAELLFMVLFLLVLAALGVANFVESSNSQAKTGQKFFGMLYILMAVLLIVYKIQNP
jgi:multisubunit Na+/H+ antiporter MnhG subunit